MYVHVDTLNGQLCLCVEVSQEVDMLVCNFTIGLQKQRFHRCTAVFVERERERERVLFGHTKVQHTLGQPSKIDCQSGRVLENGHICSSSHGN